MHAMLLPNSRHLRQNARVTGMRDIRQVCIQKYAGAFRRAVARCAAVAALGVALALSLLSVRAAPFVSFTSVAMPAVGTTPVAVAVGDFNRDGKGDLAVANALSNTVSVLLGNGNGTFQTQHAYT